MANVSVIIPVYNVKPYLDKALTSICSQTLSDLQIILIDDGSTDGSESICNEYASKDNRIVLVHQKNNGVSAARNYGLYLASGKYIFFMDADDYVEPDMLSNMFLIAEKKQCDLVISGFYYESCFMNKNHELQVQSYPVTFHEKFYCSKEEFKYDFVELWDKNLLYNIANKLYRLDMIRNHNLKFISIAFGEDFDFNKKYLTTCDKICIDEKCYYHYVRERNGASTTKYNANLFEIRVREHKEMIQYFKEYGISGDDSREFLARRHIERIVGCIENTFNKPTKCPITITYNDIKNIIHDFYTREALKYAKPHSRKMKLMLIPIKTQSTFVTVLMGNFIHLIRKYHPDTFTKLKQSR